MAVGGRSLLTAVALAAALAVAFTASGQVGGDGERWIVVDGPGAGMILATPPGSTVVASAGPNARGDNALYGAIGRIAEPDACGQRHFHGNLGPLPDPRPAECGWGRVVRLLDASFEAHMLASAHRDEREALLILAPLNRSDPGAKGRFDRAFLLLKRSIEALVDLSNLTAHQDLKQLIHLSERERAEVNAEIARWEEGQGEAHKAQGVEALLAIMLEKANVLRGVTASGRHLRDRSACTMTGTDGPDVLRGGPGRDFICSGDGDDVINAGGGNDVVFAGEGDDQVDAGAGNDGVHAGGGNDTTDAGPGNDQVVTGTGNDRTSGGPGRDVVDDRREQDGAAALRALQTRLRDLNRQIAQFDPVRDARLDVMGGEAPRYSDEFAAILRALPGTVFGRRTGDVLWDLHRIDELLTRARTGGLAGAQALDNARTAIRSLAQGASPSARVLLNRMAGDVAALRRRVPGDGVQNAQYQRQITRLHNRKRVIVRTTFPRFFRTPFLELLLISEQWGRAADAFYDSLFLNDPMSIERGLTLMHEAKERLERVVDRALR